MADVVDALIGLLYEPRAEGDVFNIGSSEEISIKELARLIVTRTASSSPITQLPYDVAYEVGFEDMTRRVPDVRKLNQLTGWVSQRSLLQVLDDVISEVKGEVDAFAVAGGHDPMDF